MKKQKTLLKVCRAIVIILLAWTFIDGIILIVKGATNAGLASFVIAFTNFTLLMFHNAQIQNVELCELIDKQFECCDGLKKVISDICKERVKDILLFSKRSEATAEEIEKIIELSQKRMVNGLPQERYTCFINEVLSAIHGFAERAKHNLLNRTYEVTETRTENTTTYEVKNGDKNDNN